MHHHGGIRAGSHRNPQGRPKDPEQWERYITGLWLSGLLVDRGPHPHVGPGREAFCVNLADEVFIIRAEGQKSGRAETCPMTPDFVAWLQTVPAAERTGRVFRLIDTRTNQPLTPERVTAVAEQIGKAAGVKVGTRIKRDKKTGTTTTVPVFAGCHSYRRGFGSKWCVASLPFRLAVPDAACQHQHHDAVLRHHGCLRRSPGVAGEIRLSIARCRCWFATIQQHTPR